MSFLTLAGINKRFGSATALDAIDLSIQRGSRTAIVGPSGSGKSTLLRIIAGSEAPDAGTITLDGILLADGPRVVPAYRRGIGIVAQDGALFPHLSVADNIGFGLSRRDPARTARIRELTAMVELDASLLSRRPDQLSGGQQQRVALARALAPKPRLILLDEPFSALDTALRAATREAVAGLLATAGVTTILVTHDQAEALSFADQVAVLRGGKLPQIGTPETLYWRPADAMVAEFLGEAILLDAEIAGTAARTALGLIPLSTPPEAERGRILLRPEQIGLSIIDGAANQTHRQAIGEVVATHFAGAMSSLSIRLLPQMAPAVAPPLLVLSRPSAGLPGTGALVQISVIGSGHWLAAG